MIIALLIIATLALLLAGALTAAKWLFIFALLAAAAALLTHRHTW